ncbi:MAG: type II toxin-antitoxin system ChpB family toxin [Methylotenera sp.]|nr:type II toxin-antitoxin system ChpB family toxin [Methylotenera sp.]
MKTAKRGEIWQLNLNPTSGKEQQGMRPVLVVSTQAFNQTGLSIICPITQGGNQVRFAGFAVSLIASGTQTQGIIMCNQPRTVDMMARQGQFIEMVSSDIVSEVLAKLQAILE